MNSFVSKSPDQMVKLVTALQHWWFPCEFKGMENLPGHSRLLFVGNHTLYGLLDVPLLFRELKLKYGIHLHGLGDRGHFYVPGWRELLTAFGVVEGTPENCAALMKADKSILVFPGGGREVWKRKGEAYQLIWKNRAGFARLAAEYDYTIIPFAGIGAEECYDIHLDANEVSRILPPKLRATKLYTQTLRNGEAIPPLVTGLGYTLIPKRQKFTFRIGQPVETAHIDPADNDQVWALREEVRGCIDSMLAQELAGRRGKAPAGQRLRRMFLKKRSAQRKKE